MFNPYPSATDLVFYYEQAGDKWSEPTIESVTEAGNWLTLVE